MKALRNNKIEARDGQGANGPDGRLHEYDVALERRRGRHSGLTGLVQVRPEKDHSQECAEYCVVARGHYQGCERASK